MSEVHLHGVVTASARGAVESAGARAIVHGALAAVASDVEPGQTRAAELMRRHWRVLEALALQTSVVPVRFGTAMPDEQAVVDEFLVPRHDALAGQLAALEGKVQVTVKGTYDEQALMRSIVEGSPAVARLRERVRSLPEAAARNERIRLGELVAAEVARARERDAAWLLERLEGLALATSRESAGGIDGAVNAAFLVERDRLPAFGDAVGAAAEQLAGRVTLRYLGPLPPYSFASEQAEGTPAWA
jgi:hypothetical protein